MRSEEIWDQKAGSPHSTEGLSRGSWLWRVRESLWVVSLTLSLGKSTPPAPPQRQAGPGEAGLTMQLRTPEQQQERHLEPGPQE